MRSFDAVLVVPDAVERETLRATLSGERFNIVQAIESFAALNCPPVGDAILIVVDGIPVAQLSNIREQCPDCRLAYLSDSFSLDEMLAVFRAGADACIPRHLPCESLVTSLHLVALGERVVPSEMVDALPLNDVRILREDDRAKLRRANLSPREADILGCLALGCPNKEISRRLDISEATVALYVKTILRKLDVRNRTQAAIRAVLGGLEQAS